jgi:hypothetical protein
MIRVMWLYTVGAVYDWRPILVLPWLLSVCMNDGKISEVIHRCTKRDCNALWLRNASIRHCQSDFTDTIARIGPLDAAWLNLAISTWFAHAA